MKRIPIYSNWVVCHPLNIQFKTFPGSTFFTASRNGFLQISLRTCSTSSPTRTPAFSACDPGLFRSKLRGHCQGWACFRSMFWQNTLQYWKIMDSQRSQIMYIYICVYIISSPAWCLWSNEQHSWRVATWVNVIAKSGQIPSQLPSGKLI